MSTLYTKLQALIRDLNEFQHGATGTRYWLDQRCLILLTHLYTEHLLEQLLIKHRFTERKVKGLTYRKKVDTLHMRGKINCKLYDELIKLNNARNAVGHNLNIIGRLAGIDHHYLDMATTKRKAAKFFEQLANLVVE